MMAATTALASFSLFVFVLRRGNTFPRLDSRDHWTGLRQCWRIDCNRGGGGGRIGRPRFVQELSHNSADLLDIQRAKARHPIRSIEIPRILRQADEIPDRRIRGPGARKALMSEPDPIDLIGGSGVAGGGSPVIGEAGFARSAAFGDRFLSASDCSAA